MVREGTEHGASPERVHTSHSRRRTSDDSRHGSERVGNGNQFELSDPALLGRLGYFAVTAFAFSTGLKVYEGAGIWGPSVPIGLALYMIAIAALAAGVWLRRPLGRRSQGVLGVLLLFVLASSVAFEISHSNPGYGTDAIAFAHVGADVLLDGENPYTFDDESLGRVLDRFGVPATFVTRSLSGEPIDRLISYPGGHVLAYATGAALGVEDMRWVTLIAELAAIGLIWWSVQPQIRAVLIAVLLIEPNLTVLFTSGGVTDWLWVFPLLAACLALIRERHGWAGIAVGVACAMKQQPWFAVPFVAVWVYKTATGTAGLRLKGPVGTFVGGLAAGFLSLNLPFILWDSAGWIRGVLAPALSDLVPDGQGLSILASRGLLPLPKEAFTLAMIIVGIAAVALFFRFFDRARDLMWVIPPVIMLFSYRSFHNYYVYWVPIVLFWLCLKRRDWTVPPERRGTRRGSSGFGPVAVIVVLFVLAVPMLSVVARNAPLEVQRVIPNLADGVITSLTVELTNNSDHEAVPLIDVYWSGWPVPWKTDLPEILQPGETRVVTAVPTSPEVLPPMRQQSDGGRAYEPFRVRVNARGHSQFHASNLIDVPRVDMDVVNPGLSLWGRIGHNAKPAPFGWTAVYRNLEGAHLSAGPVGGDRGVVFRVANSESTEQGWAEIGLEQHVPRLAACYRIQLSYVRGGPESALPTGDVGVQLIQGDSSLWFVASSSVEPGVTDLPGNTRIVRLQVPPADWIELTLDVEKYAEGSALQTGGAASIKLFNTLLSSEPGPQEFSVSAIASCDPSAG